MNSPQNSELLVVGAGLAGLSVATAAIEAGIGTTVIDRAPVGSGASGMPQALLNPATGRNAKQAWRAMEALQRGRQLLERADREGERSCWVENGVLRPALEEKIAARFRREMEKGDWPPGSIRWIDREEFSRLYPSLRSFGGLWIPVACTVETPRFLGGLVRWLQSEGVHFILPSSSKQHPKGESAKNSSGTPETEPLTPDTGLPESRWTVYALGRGFTNHPLFRRLPLHCVKGQTLTLRLREPLPFDCSLSSIGYITQGASADGSVVLGATFEHRFDHDHPDREGRDYLLQRLEKTLPGFGSGIDGERGWAGIRVTTPDHRPFAGRHPELEEAYALGGLGSKGLMYAPLLGKLLVETILGKGEIPGPFRIERLLRKG